MIKDKMQLQGFGGVKLPKIKGEVEIRLHNPTTGKTEIQRGENMVTNAVYDIFANNLCGCLNYNSMLPLYEKMFGGVLCFKKQLNVNSPSVDAAKADYFIPDTSGGQSVTAHAGQSTVTDQSDDPTRGSKSASNMSVTDGTVKLAWEWGLSEGNGDIEALALTHADVGTSGTGSTSQIFQAMTPNINASYGLAPSKPVQFIDTNDYGYTFSVSGTTLTIKKFPMPYKNVGLIGLSFDYLDGKEKTKTFTMGTSHSKSPYYAFDKTSSILYLFYNTSKSTTVYVDIINLASWDSASISSTTWTTDIEVGALQDYHQNGNEPIPLPICRGYVYLPVNEKNYDVINTTEFLKVEISRTVNQTEIEGNSTRVTGVFSPNADGRIIVGKDFVINNGVFYPTAVGTPDVIMHSSGINLLENTILDQGVGLVQMARKKTEYSSGYLYYPSISKFYLATKFNLNSKVTKTPSQSMIVTYTLTEVAPNE